MFFEKIEDIEIPKTITGKVVIKLHMGVVFLLIGAGFIPIGLARCCFLTMMHHLDAFWRRRQ